MNTATENPILSSKNGTPKKTQNQVKQEHIKYKPFTNNNLIKIINGLTALGELEIENFSLNYAIARNTDILTSHLKTYQKMTKSLRDKHIKKNEDGSYATQKRDNGIEEFVFVDNTHKQEYISKVEKLGEQVVEVEKLFTLKTSMLNEVKGIKPNMLLSCMELVVDDTDMLKDFD